MKAIVIALCLFGLTSSPVIAQEVNDEDPLIGIRRLSEWKKLLRHEDPDRRSETAFYLGLTRSKAAVPTLVEALDDEHYSVQMKAAQGLGFCVTDAGVDALIRTLKNENGGHDELVRGVAAAALGRCCRVSPKHTDRTIPELIAALGMIDTNGTIRKLAARGLARIGPEAIPALIEATQGRNGRVSITAAVDGLQQIGLPAVPALVEALGDPHVHYRRPIAHTLYWIGPPVEAVPALVRAIKEEDDGMTRTWAAGALGKVGPDAKAAVPTLIEALSDDNRRVRSSAVRALGRIGPDAKAAVPAITARLSDKEELVRSGAAGALIAFGPHAKSAVPELIKTLKDDYYYARARSVKALGSIGPDARSAVPPLIQMLGDESKSLRRESALALGSIGPDARAALPVLKDLSKDLNSDVANAATEAIDKIAE